MIHEPAVALTDYAIAVESGVLSLLVLRRSSQGPRCWFALFFLFIAVAAAVGGTVHGFVPDESGMAFAILWRATLLSIGATATAGVLGAGYAGWSRAVQRVVSLMAVGGFVAYVLCVLFVSQKFVTTMYIYLPGSVFLFVTFIAVSCRAAVAEFTRRKLRIGALGMLLTFVAAGVQQSTLAVGVLDHNAIYHVIQAVALVLIYVGVRESMARSKDGANQRPAPDSVS